MKKYSHRGMERLGQLLDDIAIKLLTPPETLSLPHTTLDRAIQRAESIARRLFLIPQLPSDMATVTTSIGTSSRDYSTIAGWEADLDNGGIYSSSDDAVGECYNDSVFNESPDIDGGGAIGLSSVTLSVASGERHDGTEGTGARIVRSDITGKILTLSATSSRKTSVEWLEVDANGGRSDPMVSLEGNSQKAELRNCIVHGSSNGFGNDMQGIAVAFSGACILNTILYDVSLTNTGSVDLQAIRVNTNIRQNDFANITIHGITKSGSSGGAYGLYLSSDDVDERARNIISTDVTGGAVAACFEPASPTNAVMSHNLSSDSTASGTGAVTSVTASGQFVSIVGGSEDLHLKTGADAIDAGTDLGTTPSGVEIDIDGRDRDTEGDTWDIGAHEFVSGGGAAATVGALIGGGLVNSGLVNGGLLG